MNINVKVRHDLNKTIQKLEKDNGGCYFSGEFPFVKYQKALEEVGVILVQEDWTPFEGFFCGSKGNTFLNFTYNGQPVDNSVFIFQWYTMNSGSIEITAYIS